MKIIGAILLMFAIMFSVVMIGLAVSANYQYENTISSNWLLADKASTIIQKSEYIDKFVEKLKSSGLQGYNDALMFPTPDNSFDENFKALESLQGRLHNIQKMDENSFAYQTAIQQITAQEQGEAKNMLEVFFGVWFKAHYYLLWNPFLVMLWIIIAVVSGAFGFGMLLND